MTSLRRRVRLYLLLAAFVCGQLAVLSHAAEAHDHEEANGHVCLVCLAGHDLQSAVPPTIAGTLTLPAAPCHWAATRLLAPPQPAVVRCRARAPPVT
jgi:hypothetical protein